MSLLDAQPQRGQMLAQEVRSWEKAVVEGVKLWSEVLWRHRREILAWDNFLSGLSFQKTTSFLASSLKMAAIAPLRQEKVIESSHIMYIGPLVVPNCVVRM